ncbi:MAG: hypothetical protein ACLFWR_11255 [Acidimicrobiales bacterium]
MTRLARVDARRFLVLLIALALTVTACGDDGGDDAVGGGDGDGIDTEQVDADTDSDDAEQVDAGAGAGECAGNSASGEAPHGDFATTHAVAISLADGSAYTVYLSDFELRPDDVSQFSGPEIPDDGRLFTVAVTVFNAEDPEALEPLTAGQEVGIAEEFGELTFVVTAQDAEGQYGNNMEAEGTVTITSVGDRFCGEITYADTEKSLSGTFDAPVKAG